MSVRIAIIGSRDFGALNGYTAALQKVFDFVDSLPQDWVVVSGGAPGPDAWSVACAKDLGLAFKEHLPEDGKYSYKVARLERNKLIAADCDILVGFWDGGSSGTYDTFKRVIARRRPARMVREWDPNPTVAELQRLLGCA